jgi:hypothetical protein
MVSRKTGSAVFAGGTGGKSISNIDLVNLQ